MVVVGFVVGGGFFLLIVVGSGVGCGVVGCSGCGLQWLGWVFFVDCGGLRWVAGVGCGWVWVAGRGGFVLRCSKHTM